MFLYIDVLLMLRISEDSSDDFGVVKLFMSGMGASCFWMSPDSRLWTDAQSRTADCIFAGGSVPEC